ncbi:MAG: chaperone NapD [Dyella sp.]|nr:chaperone NapD [Dyella sp.]
MSMSAEQHISSLVVLHRPDALPAIQAFVDTHPALELAAHGNCRCVLLCEVDSQRAVMDHIDALEAVPGVINVSLIYHHAEPREALEEPVGPGAP